MAIGPDRSSNDFDFRRNLILRTLADCGFRYIIKDLERVELPRGMTLSSSSRPLRYTYFPLSGLLSVVATLAGPSLEVGVIGREGKTGTRAFFDRPIPSTNDRVALPLDAFVQIPGRALRMEYAKFRSIVGVNNDLRVQCLPFLHRWIWQITEAAVANACCSIRVRVVRRILMTDDRIGGDAVPLTHEALATALAVRRPSITLVLGQLEAEGLLRHERGRLFVLERDRLRAIAGLVYTPLTLH